MRTRNLIPLLVLASALAAAGCDLPTDITIEPACLDLVFGCDNNNSGAWSWASTSAKRLRVTTVTTGTPLDSGVVYRLDVTNGVAGAGWTIPPNHSEIYAWDSNTVGEADHLVTLSDVPAHCEVQGENPRTVTIVRMTYEAFLADPIEATFEVVCG